MKQSVTQILDFFKKHKYGRLSLALLVLGMLIASVLLLMRSKTQQDPIPVMSPQRSPPSASIG